jgi:GTPase SAR1 family protein
MLVFDIAHRDSFNELDEWITDLNTLSAPNAFILLVGNKIDCIQDRMVTEDQARETAEKSGLDDIETSAKTGANLAEAFARLALGVLRGIRAGTIALPPVIRREDPIVNPFMPPPRQARQNTCGC